MTRRDALGAFVAPTFARTGAGAPAPVISIPAERSPRKRRAFARSDVVFGFPFTPEEYKMWGGTVVFGWTGGPRTKADIPKFVARQREARAVGARMGTSINAFATHRGRGLEWFQERDPGWHDGLWRDARGELLIEPWIRPPDPLPPEKGRMCSNHPLHLTLKFEQADLALAVETSAFHLDDPLATATVLGRDGCFCRYCKQGFQDYLRTSVPPDVLRAAGAASLDRFDYAEFLRAKPGKPLWHEFENFQLRRAVENFKSVVAYARKKHGGWIPVGANAPTTGAHIVFAPHLDYICAEVGTDAKELRFGAKPLLNYKMADAFGTAIAATGIYRDWVMLWQHDIPDLVRGWVAESYALGGNFIVPHKEWGFIQPPGQEPRNIAYPGKVELIGPLYRFVREHRELFDGYESVRQVALLYDYRAHRARPGSHEMPQTAQRTPTPLHEICLALANANIQFGMAVAGDEPLDHTLEEADLAEGESLIVTEPVLVRGRQKALLDRWERQGRVIRWESIGKTLAALPRVVRSVPEGGEVWVLPRLAPGNPSAPLVCHVLNRVFDARTERLATRKRVRVLLSREIFGSRPHRNCTMYMERQSPRPLAVKLTGNFVEVLIPELELWAALRFS